MELEEKKIYDESNKKTLRLLHERDVSRDHPV